jgi:probable F420-dependent oxidoreductase
VKWGIVFVNSGPFASPEMARALAETAEEAGFESLWGGDHVVMPATYRSEYPMSDSGKFSTGGKTTGEKYGDDQDIPDPLVHFAYLAALTNHIRLGTSVVILPQRNPLVLAKQAATVDSLSGGRFTLGVGVGWLEEEFTALGIPWEHRGPRSDEYIEVMRTLWRDSESTFHGRFADFDTVKCNPKPVQRPGIPIHIGGHNRAAARRAGRLGDGFCPAIFPNSAVRTLLPELIDEMRRAATAAGRDADAIEITSGGARTADAARWYADIGVHRLVIRARATDPAGLREELLRFGDEVIAKTSD